MRSWTDKDALLLVDIQNDFCPGGALPVPAGNEIVGPANRWIRDARRAGALVIASRDSHPRHHPSFGSHGGPWPEHCVTGTHGADLHPDLDLPGDAVHVTKGTRLDRDQYSAFDETGLGDFLRQRGVTRIWIGGLAEDVCVKASALDAAAQGFEVHLLRDATMPLSAEAGHSAREEMARAGVMLEPAETRGS